MNTHNYPNQLKLKINMSQRGLKFPTSQLSLPTPSDIISETPQRTLRDAQTLFSGTYDPILLHSTWEIIVHSERY